MVSTTASRKAFVIKSLRREVVGELERQGADGRAGIDRAHRRKEASVRDDEIGDRVHAPAGVGDRGRGIAAHTRRPEKVPSGQWRKRHPHRAMSAGCTQHLLGAIEAKIERAPRVLGDAIVDFHARQAVGLDVIRQAHPVMGFRKILIADEHGH